MGSLKFPVDGAGRVRRARQIPSPNFDARPPRMPISLLVIHNISLPPNQFGGDDIIRLFTNTLDPKAHPSYQELQGLQVSAHFLVRRDGELIQFVPCLQRAWHAGVSLWRGRPHCNAFSIGIELEGCDTRPFEAAQYEVLAALANSLCEVYPIRAIVGHSDIAPGRKTDPGPCFDWAFLRENVTDCPNGVGSG
ncbi:MAG: 1,6-anhydro-N-acetylmuramyl-L-alanine amidase AmpD [Betaproteobacteria bacterium]|nr:1,6-anhydro-N-acetylmuramyl-L-alanine amidase AmpD [Betaproteobacteria bacterium]